MGTITVKKKINYPTDIAWSLISDYANIYKFHPMLTNSFINHGSTSCGIGAERTCQMPAGMNLVERVIDWQEGESYTVRITSTNMPINTAQATIGVRAINTDLSLLHFKINYKVKFGILGKLMDILMMRWMFRIMIGMLINSLAKEIARTSIVANPI